MGVSRKFSTSDHMMSFFSRDLPAFVDTTTAPPRPPATTSLPKLDTQYRVSEKIVTNNINNEFSSGDAVSAPARLNEFKIDHQMRYFLSDLSSNMRFFRK